MFHLNFARLNSFYLRNLNKKLIFANQQTSVLFSTSKKCENVESELSTKSRKRYNKPPPIDLKSVRVRETENKSNDDDSFRPISFLLLSIPIITFCLGVWQVKRRQWKIDLVNFLNERTKSEPRPMPTEAKELETLTQTSEYCPFKVKGYFLHSKEIILSPRHDMTGSSNLPGGIVITPFVVSDRPNLTILVNRGYVPYMNYSPMSRKQAQIEDEVEIVGLLRSNEVKNAFTPDNKPPTEWHYRDIDAMAKCLHTAPLFIDASEASTIRGGPVAGQTTINLRNEHMTYVITWFSLSAITAFLWWRNFGRKLFKK